MLQAVSIFVPAVALGYSQMGLTERYSGASGNTAYDGAFLVAIHLLLLALQAPGAARPRRPNLRRMSSTAAAGRGSGRTSGARTATAAASRAE